MYFYEYTVKHTTLFTQAVAIETRTCEELIFTALGEELTTPQPITELGMYKASEADKTLLTT